MTKDELVATTPKFNLLFIPSLIQLLFLSAVPKYLNSANFQKIYWHIMNLSCILVISWYNEALSWEY